MYQALDTAPAGFARVPLQFGPYSASKLQVARCPARFRGKFILHDVTVGDNLASARGNAIHEVLQKISEARVRGEDFHAGQVNTWVADAVGKYPAAYAQVDVVKRAAAAYVGNPCPYLNGTTTCETAFAVSLYEEESLLQDSTPGRAYVKMPVPTDGSRVSHPDVYFAMKADLISIDEMTKTVTILDHKSTPNASTNNDHTFQLGCYAWVVSLFYPGYKIRTVLHYAHPDLNFYAKPDHWCREDIQDFEDEIRARIFSIESFQEYPAIPSSQCDYCHMVQTCPTFLRLKEQHERGALNLRPQNVEDLKGLAENLRVLEILFDDVNGALKEGIEKICPTNGVAIDGMWYGFKVGDPKPDWNATEAKIADEVTRAKQLLQDPNLSEEARLPLEKLVQAGSLDGLIAKSGLAPSAFKTWKGDRLAALSKLADKQELVKTLHKYAVYESTTRFKGYKI